MTNKETMLKTFNFKDKLNDKFFINDKLDKKIRKVIINIVDEFLENLSLKLFIHDITLTGSLANYNWSKYSDVDLHIIVDFSEYKIDKDIIKDFFDTKKSLFNDTHNIKIFNHDVEIYIQDINEEHQSNGIYSVLKNKWVLKPTKEKKEIDNEKIIEKANFFIKEIEESIRKKDLNKILKIKNKIKKFRKIGLDKYGEFSYENLTFKLLRRLGYIDKLYNENINIIDKKLSI